MASYVQPLVPAANQMNYAHSVCWVIVAVNGP